VVAVSLDLPRGPVLKAPHRALVSDGLDYRGQR